VRDEWESTPEKIVAHVAGTGAVRVGGCPLVSAQKATEAPPREGTPTGGRSPKGKRKCRREIAR